MKVLKVNSVTQKFGGLTALNDINIDIEEGEIIGIIGPNGAGKTTLFNVITGIYTPTAGQVFLKEENITGEKPHIIAKKGFARTFQNIRLFPKMTVLDNIILGMHSCTETNLLDAIFKSPKKRKEDKYNKEKAFEILDVLDLYNYRYEMADSLSYGNQRKLEIARALATEPILLLLDEPAAGMNEVESEELEATIRKLKKMGYTIILIEHDMKFVMNICERLYVLNYGNLISEGTSSEVKKDPAVIEAYLGKDVE